MVITIYKVNYSAYLWRLDHQIDGVAINKVNEAYLLMLHRSKFKVELLFRTVINFMLPTLPQSVYLIFY